MVPVPQPVTPAPATAAALASRPAAPVRSDTSGATFGDALDAARATASAPSPPPPPPGALTLGQMLASLRRGAPAPPATTASLAATAAPTDAATGTSTPGDGNSIVTTAKRYLGIPYRWGGTDPRTGFDCSGLVQQVFGDLGVTVPRVSADQARAGTAVPSLAQAQPGDLLFWTGSRTNHIGIYVGDGKMLHAPRTGDVVKIGPIRSAPPTAIRRIAV